MSETHPGFNELRKRHQITLEALIEDTQIDPRAVLLMDTWGIGTPDHIDTLLESLSRLAGMEYSRQAMNVWDLTFKLHPDYESITDIEKLLAIDSKKIGEEH
jgi:hypothetical protein